MDIKNDKQTTPKQQIEEGIGNAATAAHSVLERGTEVYDHAKQTVSDVYDKTSKAVCKTCEQAKSYTSKNPGTTILIALGLGLGVGILLGARTHHSRTGRFAQPVVNALSDIALELFR
jgi:ElaB/YqjD/DUF883 family membrane-anchored ribosome-binding protein